MIRREILVNIAEPPMGLWHASLERVGESAYRSHCPACDKGMLFVGRDQETMKLLRRDRCTWCGQEVRYLDAGINGEEFE